MKRLLMIVALLVGAYLVTPAEAQGRFWVLVNGALRYTGSITATGTGTFGTVAAGSGSFSSVNGLSAAGIVNSGSYNVGDTAAIFWNTRTLFRSPANALLHIKNNAETIVSYEVNVGTAAPTATTCGTGTATAHSTNMAGQITATGATTCTVTFGAPAWSFAPFCSVTDVTTAAALRISASGTTSITVTNLTSNDVFNWVCGGGGI